MLLSVFFSKRRIDLDDITLKGSGVDYDAMDPQKIRSLRAGLETASNLGRFGFSEVPWSRGESVYLIETPWCYFGFVVEGLGTKSLVADGLHVAEEVAAVTGKSHYDQVGQCNVAMAVNDVITSGALPFVYNQYLAVQSGDWFADKARARDLIEGTKRACMLAGCVWGGGETPTLNDIIVSGTCDLAGATIGIVSPKSRLVNPANIRDGDVIVVLKSSGIHANGLSSARKLAKSLPDGYLTLLPDGRTYGEALLDPTIIYAPYIEALLNAGVEIHYIVNITGHGWRKLMRAPFGFTYVVKHLPRVPTVLQFIQERGSLNPYDAYATFNMGGGMALILPKEGAERTLRTLGDAFPDLPSDFICPVGHVESSAKRSVVIAPLGITYDEDSLQVR